MRDVPQPQLASAITPAEAELLAAFRAMSDEYRGNSIIVMQSLARSFPRQRPTLTLVAGQRQHRRSAGFGDPFVLLGIGVIALLVWFMVSDTPPRSDPPAPDPQPAALAGASIAYVPYVFADQATGCQYLSTHTSTGLVPRIAADGKTHMGCKGGSNAKS